MKRRSFLILGCLIAMLALLTGCSKQVKDKTPSITIREHQGIVVQGNQVTVTFDVYDPLKVIKDVQLWVQTTTGDIQYQTTIDTFGTETIIKTVDVDLDHELCYEVVLIGMYDVRGKKKDSEHEYLLAHQAFNLYSEEPNVTIDRLDVEHNRVYYNIVVEDPNRLIMDIIVELYKGEQLKDTYDYTMALKNDNLHTMFEGLEPLTEYIIRVNYRVSGQKWYQSEFPFKTGLSLNYFPTVLRVDDLTSDAIRFNVGINNYDNITASVKILLLSENEEIYQVTKAITGGLNVFENIQWSDLTPDSSYTILVMMEYHDGVYETEGLLAYHRFMTLPTSWEGGINHDAS